LVTIWYRLPVLARFGWIVNPSVNLRCFRASASRRAAVQGLFQRPPHHGDPFGRQIISQALAESIPVVTPDKSFKLYKGLEGIR